jgi:hypothetical protein
VKWIAKTILSAPDKCVYGRAMLMARHKVVTHIRESMNEDDKVARLTLRAWICDVMQLEVEIFEKAVTEAVEVVEEAWQRRLGQVPESISC